MSASLNSTRRTFKEALLYFFFVFGMGFFLGPIRIFLLVPRVGVRAAELLEMPIMVLVTVIAARWIVRRTGPDVSRSTSLSIGLLGLCFLVLAEVGLGIWLRDMTLTEYITERDPVSGVAYFMALALFGIMPLIVARHWHPYCSHLH